LPEGLRGLPKAYVGRRTALSIKNFFSVLALQIAAYDVTPRERDCAVRACSGNASKIEAGETWSKNSDIQASTISNLGQDRSTLSGKVVIGRPSSSLMRENDSGSAVQETWMIKCEIAQEYLREAAVVQPIRQLLHSPPATIRESELFLPFGDRGKITLIKVLASKQKWRALPPRCCHFLSPRSWFAWSILLVIL
jgi:hypothetical protein